MHPAFAIFLLFAIHACNSNQKPESGRFEIKSIILADSMPNSELAGNFNNSISREFDSSWIERFIEFHPSFNDLKKELIIFYSNRRFTYAWHKQQELIEQTNILHNRIIQLIDHGIPYQAPYLEEYKKMMESEYNGNITARELMITCQYLSYANSVLAGLTEKDSKANEWFIPRKKINYDTLLKSLLHGETNEIDKQMYPEYLQLQEKLKAYSIIEKNTPWERIPFEKKPLHIGDTSYTISLVRKRLYLLGDIEKDNGSSLLDLTLSDGIKKFQDRHGLTADGIIGQNIKDEINIPIEERIKTIIINMERCKWLPNETDQDHIIVNIPEFTLEAFKKDSLIFQCNVVVGKETNKTMIFKGDMKYIVFSPFWNVPESIIKKEIIPAIKKNPNYLSINKMEWVDGQIRQLPGPENSLGLVKFLFPNIYNIYLHDTPSKGLFKLERRTFSHGCIRISEPMKMIKFLLDADPTWTEEKIDESLHGGKEKYVVLKKSIPVYIIYLTSFVDEKGLLNFRRDIYERDNGLKEMIFDKK